MFDIHQSACDEHEELDERKTAEYIDGLMEEFEKSAEAQPVIQAHQSLCWADQLMSYAFDHLGVAPPEMSLYDFDEVVFRIFPRKMSVEPDEAPRIIDELRAFWTFIDRRYQIPNAKIILDRLDDGALDLLREELANPRNYGMAKSFIMKGKEAGFDMTTQEGLNQFMLVYNSAILARQESQLSAPRQDFLPKVVLLSNSSNEPLPGLAPGDLKQRRKAKKAQRQAKKKHRKR